MLAPSLEVEPDLADVLAQQLLRDVLQRVRVELAPGLEVLHDVQIYPAGHRKVRQHVLGQGAGRQLLSVQRTLFRKNAAEVQKAAVRTTVAVVALADVPPVEPAAVKADDERGVDKGQHVVKRVQQTSLGLIPAHVHTLDRVGLTEAQHHSSQQHLVIGRAERVKCAADVDDGVTLKRRKSIVGRIALDVDACQHHGRRALLVHGHDIPQVRPHLEARERRAPVAVLVVGHRAPRRRHQVTLDQKLLNVLNFGLMYFVTTLLQRPHGLPQVAFVRKVDVHILPHLLAIRVVRPVAPLDRAPPVQRAPPSHLRARP